ncbi:MAG: transcriptional repressor LexA [Planctomycetaceae bacterium]
MSQSPGQQVRAAREARGITLRAFADRLGIHYSHLSKFENGKCVVGRRTLTRIADELGEDPDLLLGGAGHQSLPFRIVGTIAAGQPIEAVEDFETFDLTRQYNPEQHFLLRIRGESMIDAGIHDGDLAIIRQSGTASNGDIVAAVVDGEATLKRFMKRGSTICLIPENPAMSEMKFHAHQVEIRGVFVGLVRTS